MQKSKRLRIIKEFVKSKKDVQISQINELIDVSESTIRRDIKELAEQGFLKEEYGSILYSKKNVVDIVLSERNTRNIEAKKIIGKKAAALIKENDFVYLDAGSTTFYVIDYLDGVNASFVTNGINVATELGRKGYKVHLVGGELKTITMAIVGEEAIENLSHYHFDIGFIGTNGVSEFGFSTPDIREGILKRAVVKQSRYAYALADKTKTGNTTSFVFASNEECGLITE
jgi:DeoR family fructose operon transcriptional repressor